jgi:Ca-activated chloride channel family protein
VVLVSDGGANVGSTEHRDFLDLLEKTDVRVFTFVMGQGANQPLLSRIADASGGFSMDVSNQDDLYGRLLQVKSKLGREALHGVEVELEGAGATALTPRQLPSAYHGQQIVVLGRYDEPGEAKLRVRGKISGQPLSWDTRIVLPERSENFPEIERMWAFARAKELEREINDGGDASELRPVIVDLGTTYSIVTEYTSMIVVRDEQFAERGIDRRNRDRVERERTARQARASQPAIQTRADAAQPMYGDRPAHGTGVGASGPLVLALLAGLYGVRVLLRARDGQC